MKKYAIIVAGGSGTRMGSEIPKQFLLLANKPILIHTLEKFIKVCDETILVLPENQFDYWNKITEQFNFSHKIIICKGGNSRFQSVKNGLNCIHENGIVAIHDAVRPFTHPETIYEAFQQAITHLNAVVSVALNDSIREVSESSNKALDRSKFRLIQTPQCFDINFIKKAYETPELNIFTDDASVAEYNGLKIHLTEGTYDNIKITTPSDLVIGEAILKNQNNL